MSHRLQTARQYPKDNLYRRLGTRSNISQARIREKYVARLREFPPETHPEEFRIIREAYEILSNPETRADYDAARQGKQSWEELFEAGAKAFAEDKYDKAQKLLGQASKIRQNCSTYMMLAHCRLFGNDDLEGFEQFVSQALAVSRDDNERCTAEIIRVICLIKYDKFTEGVKQLYQTLEQYPEEKSIHYSVLPHLMNYVYHWSNFSEIFEILERLLPEKGQEDADDLELFRCYLELIDESNRWDRKSQILSRLKSLARNLQDEQDVDRAKSMFEQEFDEYEQVGRFREAELVVTFLLELDRHDVDYKEWKAATKHKVAVEKAYKKMMGDPSIFPGATTFVAYWFHLRYMPPEAMPEELESLADLATQMDYIDLSEVEYKSELGYGLHRIRKGHPAIYHAFREEWDELLAECMQGLSRKERRALK